jgi:hypothetical protein
MTAKRSSPQTLPLRPNRAALPLTPSARQNVDEAHQFVRADECADALDQKNQSEEKEKGDPGPADRVLTPQPEDDQKKGIE